MDRALEAQKQEEEADFLVSHGLLNPDTIPVRPQQVHEEHEEEKGRLPGEGFIPHKLQEFVHGWGEVAGDNVGCIVW